MNNTFGILIILGIIFLAIYGGTVGKNQGPIFKPTPLIQFNQTGSTGQSNLENAYTIQQKINDAQKKVEVLKKQLEEQEKLKIQSKYFGKIKISYVTRSTNPASEYVTLRNTSTTTIMVTGWQLKSEASGQSVNIPQGSYLYFANSPNSEQDISLSEGETMYLVTGISPNGASFKTNKCSGYLSQFQTFTPNLYTSCPLPKDEDLSSIPKTVNNDACFDYIDRMPACNIQTRSLPANWSYECVNFIYKKINYPSCIDTHKNDKDFYGKEWRVYLKRNAKIWKDKRESITLYDNDGKVVSTYKY